MTDLYGIRINNISAYEKSPHFDQIASLQSITRLNMDIWEYKTVTAYFLPDEAKNIERIFASEHMRSFRGKPALGDPLYYHTECNLLYVPAFHPDDAVKIDDEVAKAFLKGWIAAGADGYRCRANLSISKMAAENYEVNTHKYWPALDTRLTLSMLCEYALLNNKFDLVSEFLSSDEITKEYQEADFRVYTPCDGYKPNVVSFRKLWQKHANYYGAVVPVKLSFVHQYYESKTSGYYPKPKGHHTQKCIIIYNMHLFKQDRSNIENLIHKHRRYRSDLGAILTDWGVRNKDFWRWFDDIYPDDEEAMFMRAIEYLDGFVIDGETVITGPYHKDAFLKYLVRMQEDTGSELCNKVVKRKTDIDLSSASFNGNSIQWQHLKIYDGFEAIQDDENANNTFRLTLDLRTDTVIKLNAEYHGLNIDGINFKCLDSYLHYKTEYFRWKDRLKECSSLDAFLTKYRKDIEELFDLNHQHYFFTEGQIDEILELAERGKERVFYFWAANPEKTVWKYGKSTALSVRKRVSKVTKELMAASGANFEIETLIFIRSEAPFAIENEIKNVFEPLDLEGLFQELGSENKPTPFDGYTEFVKADEYAVKGLAGVIAAAAGQGKPIEIDLAA